MGKRATRRAQGSAKASPKASAKPTAKTAKPTAKPAPKPPAETEPVQQPGASTLPSPADDGSAPPGPPVVGIGASAGGLDAFKKFFIAMPPVSGIAFVLIPHLDPNHESLMVELLARHTTMPVVEAANEMPVEADRVYVIPPNKYMTIAGGVLRLSGPIERGGPQTSIDLFLRALAEDKGEKAVCIILSGTGGHGALGLKAVKAAGGMAMVQDPATADYPRMPQSAIATGLADYILPVERMPVALLKYAQHFYFNGGTAVHDTGGVPDHLSQVLALLRTRTRFDFRSYRKKMLIRRVERRMGLNHFENLPDYLAHLRKNPEEVKQLARDLFISVTSFFRDPDAFQALKTDVIAPLVQAKESDAPIRIWVPGCATGEEAYSLAILLLEQVAAAQKNCPLQIFATDVDEAALEVARQGIYPASIAADVAPERLARYFARVDEASYQVAKQVREPVVFAMQNLISDAPFSKLDLISCRNLLIYLEPDVQQKVVTLLHFALNEGGYLFLGPSETIGRQTDLFEPISKKWRVFRRVGPNRAARVEFPIATRAEPGQFRGPPESGPARPSFAELTQRLVLEQLSPAAVLINRRYEILYFLGATANYLDLPTGEPTRDLMAMAREGLRTKLRAAVHKALRENETVVLSGVQVKRNGSYVPVAATVKPLHAPKSVEGLLLITFQDQTESVAAPSSAPVDDSLVRHLEAELRATKEDLQGTVEEMESANEELKASNEEVMSMNEELQSTNEELETSKEELQSLNEELSTVNSQLHEKVQELEITNNDLANLLNCTDIATVFLDDGLRIRRFTPEAGRLFNFIAGDIGRPLGDIAKRFADDEWQQDAQQLLRDLAPREKEVRTDDGRWCVRRILPYRTLDNRIAGVVITFIDITERKLAADVVLRRLAAVVENSADAIFSADLDGIIRTWNSGAEHMYGYSAAEAVGQSIAMTVPADRTDEIAALVTRLTRGEHVEQFETERVRKDGRRIPVALTISPIRGGDGAVASASVTGRDISERKRAEQELRASEHRFRLMADAAPVMIWVSGPDRLCTWFNKPWLDFVGRALDQEVGDGWAENIHPDDRDRCLATYVAAFDAREPFSMEYRLRRYDGQYRWLLDHGVPLPDSDGAFTGYIGSCLDITERRLAEETLRREHELSDAIINSVNAIVLLLDAKGRILRFNPFLERLAGWKLAEVEGRDWFDTFLPERDRARVRDVFGQALGGVRTQANVNPIVTRDGREREIEWCDAPLTDPDGALIGLVCTGQDITERRAAEQVMARLAAIVESSNDAIIGESLDGTIESWNDAAERIFGYRRAEVMGKSIAILNPPDREDELQAIRRRLGRGERIDHFETVRLCKEGGPIDVSLAISPINDPAGRPVGVSIIARDITRRKELEREVVESVSLEQSRIGQDLHDSVAQELTALGILTGDLAETVRTDPAHSLDLIKRLSEGLQRSQYELRTVLRGLLPVSVDTGGLMSALADLADRTQQPGKLTCTFDCHEPVAVADNLTATHLYLIAQEAVHNAVKHGQPRNIRISLESDDTLVLRVQDDGVGIPAKPAEDQGLGLRIMRNRAAIIGAHLTIEPGEPRGTVVTCALAQTRPERKVREAGPAPERP